MVATAVTRIYVTARAPEAPQRFFSQNGKWKAHIDLRTHPRSKLNSKAYRNAVIARTNGRIPNVELQTNGASLLVVADSMEDARRFESWLQLFESNWGNSNL